MKGRVGNSKEEALGPRLGLGGGPRASVPGGVGGRGTGPRDGANFATCVVFLTFLTVRKMIFLKDTLWGGGGTRAREGCSRGFGSVFLTFLTRTKRRKMVFFEGCPVGWRYPPQLAWWTRR